MPEIGIIVGVNLSNNRVYESEIEELVNLCFSCDITIIDKVTQNLDDVNPTTYVGKGKVEEIKTAILASDADCIICNDELSPAQISNLEELLEVTIYDRTYVILEIFQRRAQTKEARLQVEIARLKYLLPRLAGMRKGLSRQRGTAGDAHGKGAGETQLELDRRHILEKINVCKNQLFELTKVRRTQRSQRKNKEMKTVSLVGYTNVGKSTILNAILDYSEGIKKEVLEKDMLFATLETSTRLIKLSNNHCFLLTDTIGFVQKLPHHLIEAFKSTLEEIQESDLIIHVVDASNENYYAQVNTTNQVLHSIGVKDIPTIYVFNKIDRIDDFFMIPDVFDVAIKTSAKSHANIDKLINLIEKNLFDDVFIKVLLPFSMGNVVNDLKTLGNVTKLSYFDNGIYLEAYVSKQMKMNLLKYIIEDSQLIN